MTRLAIGVDTGGTYTDAAVVDLVDRRVIAAAKALTTRGDLSIGVGEAISAAIGHPSVADSVGRIELICMSTTLATNAVVEGHGDSVGAILIGFDDAMVERSGIRAAFPDLPIVVIGGGHDYDGSERRALDIAALRNALACMRVDAFAVASLFAVRNPSHEHAARRLITDATDRPVTISTELSSALDSPRRALTAVINARLLARISGLIEAVRRAMDDLAISCPLMVVKGDATVASAESVARRPIETVLSGPAASLVGAAWLAGVTDAIVCDIGGTTTDIGIVTGGRPAVQDHGATVAGRRTMVRSVGVTTIGLGGDSEVLIAADGTVALSTNRVIPLSQLATQYPAVLAHLERSTTNTDRPWFPPQYLVLPAGSSPRFGPQPAAEQQILDAVAAAPVALREVAISSRLLRAVARLERNGHVQRSAFTPTDAAHVLGLQSNWSGRAAQLSALLVTRDGATTAEFCRYVYNAVVTASTRAVLETALGHPIEAGSTLDDVSAGARGAGHARVSVALDIALVAVGGPAEVFYRDVGRRLGAEVVIPRHAEVANAVGAAVGNVARRLSVTVSVTSGGFHVHLPAGVRSSPPGHPALTVAETEAVAWVEREVAAMGGTEITSHVTRQVHRLPWPASTKSWNWPSPSRVMPIMATNFRKWRSS